MSDTQSPIIAAMQYRGDTQAAAGTGGGSGSVNGGLVMPGFNAGQPDADTVAAGNRNVDTAKNEGERAYSENDKDAIVNRARARSQGIQDGYTDATKRDMYEHYDKNLAVDNPRGNLNGMSGVRTRNLSRMADAYNNATRWKPGLAGRRTNSSFGTNEMQANSYYKDKIETQEMRQMRANERIDEQVRGYDARRQDRVESHDMAMQEWADQAAINLTSTIGQGDVSFGNALKQLIADIEYTQPNSHAMQAVIQRFLATLPYELKSRVAAQAERVWNENPAWAQVYAYIMAGTQLPGYDDAIRQNLFSDHVRALVESGLSMEEAYIGALQHAMKLGMTIDVSQIKAALGQLKDMGFWI